MQTTTKLVSCECVNGAAILYHAAYNDDVEMVWRCGNCHRELPRRINHTGKDMTPTQGRTLGNLLTEYARRHSYSDRGYEFKDLKITQSDFGTLFVSGTFGAIDDEKSLLCLTRNHFHFAIGRAGKVEDFNKDS